MPPKLRDAPRVLPHVATKKPDPSAPQQPHVTGEKKALLTIEQQPLPHTLGLPPLTLHVASAGPDGGDSATAPQDGDGVGTSAPDATPSGTAAEADLRAARNRRKKDRAKANKAEAAAREPKAVMFSFLEAMAKFEANPGGDPTRRYLDRDQAGNFFLQDEPLSSEGSLALARELMMAMKDEWWFANRHLPFAMQLALSYEAIALALLLEPEGPVSLQSARELASVVSGAARHRTPEAVHAHWMALAKAQGRTPSAMETLHAHQAEIREGQVAQLCDYLSRAVGVAFGALRVIDAPDDTPPMRTRRDVESILAQTMMCQATSVTKLAGLVTSAQNDPTLSEHVLDFAARLASFATTPAQREALDTMSVALLVSLSPKVLRKMVVSHEELAWIQRHVFILGGHLKAVLLDNKPRRFNIARNWLTEFDPRRLVRLGEKYLAEQKGVKVVATLLRATSILQTNIEEEEARIEKLVVMESRLRLADPQVDFEGLDLGELLDTFVPRKTAVPDALDFHEHKALTHAEAALAIADVPAPADAQTAGVDDPQDTLAYWQGVWASYREKNLQRRHETAAARRLATDDNSEDEDDIKRPLPEFESNAGSATTGKQPGARPRLSGYQHHLPSSDKHLPNGVSKGRMQEIVDAIREGRKYTQDDRHQAQQRMMQKAPDVD